jgi:tetratricopeptide (TPR) repeat protein
MLETVREFAANLLAGSLEGAAVTPAHIRYFRDLAESLAPLIKSEHEIVALARLDSALDNFRAALESARLCGDVESELRILGALWLYWNVRGETKEGIEWLVEAPLGDETVGADTRAEALIGLARLTMTEGDAERSFDIGQQLIELADATSAPQRTAGWGCIAMALHVFMDRARVRALSRECIAHMTAGGDAFEQSLAYTLLGEVERTHGSPSDAAAAYEKALLLVQEGGGGERFLTALCHHNLAHTRLLLGDLDSAAEQFLKSFEAGQQLVAAKLMLYAMVGLSGVAQALRQPASAVRMLGCAEAGFARIGYSIQPADQVPRDRVEAALRREMGDAEFEELYSQGAELELDEAIDEFRAIRDGPSVVRVND